MPAKQFNKKYKKTEVTSHRRRNTSGRHTFEKMFEVTHKRNAREQWDTFPFQVRWSWKMGRAQFWHLCRKSGIFTHCWHAVAWHHTHAIHWTTVCLKAQLPKRQNPLSHSLCPLLPVPVTGPLPVPSAQICPVQQHLWECPLLGKSLALCVLHATACR